jgi:hypothetical protein
MEIPSLDKKSNMNHDFKKMHKNDFAGAILRNTWRL